VSGAVDVRSVLDAAPSVTVKGVTVLHNTAQWHVCTNRHRQTQGGCWGWIEGAPGNVCWGDGAAFDKDAAYEVVRLHREWLEDQKPVAIKLVEAREAYAAAKKTHDTYEAAYQKARKVLDECESRIAALANCGGAK